MEYGSAMSPLVAELQPGMLVNGGSGLTFRLPEHSGLTQGHGRPDLTYQVESSEDLSAASWTVLAVKTPTAPWTGSVTVAPDIGGFVRVTVATPPGATSLFLRLRMTQLGE
jgi:hypothetical protein